MTGRTTAEAEEMCEDDYEFQVECSFSVFSCKKYKKYFWKKRNTSSRYEKSLKKNKKEIKEKKYEF